MNLNSKKISMGLILIFIMTLSYVYWVGEIEKEQYRLDNEIYNHAIQLLEQQNSIQALPLLLELNNNYPDNEYILMYSGLAQAIQGNYKGASDNFQKSLNIHPALQLDPSFIIEYTKILINNNELDKSKILLEKTTNLKVTDKQKNQIKKLYTYIE